MRTPKLLRHTNVYVLGSSVAELSNSFIYVYMCFAALALGGVYRLMTFNVLTKVQDREKELLATGGTTREFLAVVRTYLYISLGWVLTITVPYILTLMCGWLVEVQTDLLGMVVTCIAIVFGAVHTIILSQHRSYIDSVFLLIVDTSMQFVLILVFALLGAFL